MTDIRIGYALCSTDHQDLVTQQEALVSLGVPRDLIYLDKELVGLNRQCPGLIQALATVRQGDTLVVPKLDRLTRSVQDALEIADALQARGVKLALGASIYDPADPMGEMFFNVLATIAEFEGNLMRLRKQKSSGKNAVKRKLRREQLKLSEKRQVELYKMHLTGKYSISDLSEFFSVSQRIVYWTLLCNRTLSERSK